MPAEFKISRLRFNYLGQWAVDTFYNRDAIVSYHGKTYVCLEPHTSDISDSAFYEALHYYTPGGAFQPRWEIVIDGHEWIGPWETNTYYSVGNIVTYGGSSYICMTEHESDTVIDLTNFEIYATFRQWHPTWEANYAYGVGDVVKYGGIVYFCNENHVSSATTTLGLEDDQDLWVAMSVGIEYKGTWNSSGANYRYKLNDIVKNGPDLWISNAGHTSTSTFDQTKWSIWMPGIEYTGSWNSSVTYQTNDVVKYGGYTYYSLTANNINNVPSLEALEWELLTTGYELSGEWANSGSYKVGNVVRRHGNSFVAIQDNVGRDPSAAAITVNKANPTYNWSATIVGTVTQGPPVGPGLFAAVMSFSVPAEQYAIVEAWTQNQSLTVTVNGTTVTTYTLAGLSGGAGSYTAIFNETNVDYGGVSNLSFVGVNVGTTLTVQSTTGLVPGMIVSGIGFTLGQRVSKILSSTDIQLSVPPDGTVTLGYGITFDAVNYVYWDLITPGVKWLGFWSINAEYVPGDLVVWQNNTYMCIKKHDTNTNSASLRPDISVNSYWIVFVPHDRRNALSLPGAIPSFNAGEASSLAIGTTDQVLRVVESTELVPAWRQILVTPKVYYVATSGEDRVDYGVTWDRPWKTIKYAANFVNNGTENAGTRQALYTNKEWLLAEMYQWMLYQVQEVNAPFTIMTTFNQAKTVRDAGYVIDALIYDVSRVGNSQTVAAISAYFKPDGSDSFFNTEVTEQMPVFIASLTYLQTLINQNVMFNNPPAVSYQELMEVPENELIDFNNLYSPEVSARTDVSSLLELLIDALTNSTTRHLPAPNQGISATIFVKTGTYSEQLPIVVPAQTAIVGDELRGVVVQPLLVIDTFATRSSDIDNTVTVYSTDGLYDKCPIQFVKQSYFITNLDPFEVNITAGQTYYVIGSSITPTTFTFSATPGGPPVVLDGDIGFIQLIGGDALSDMFHLRNATGLRNLTLTGLLGTLTAFNEFLTQRPTGGSYCAFDPGKGPDDTVVWIQKRSPYLQNVTLFGVGCTAMKVDGDLHNGGNRSMTANDFTCIISDGIGAWIKGTESKAELISVFSYYNYTSYFAEDGGRIRAANGNSSYGTYGCIAEGYDVNEEPITAKINNQQGQAKASVQQAFGTDAVLLKLQYSNAGVEYNQNTTNLLSYSNNFVDASWVTDGNVQISQNLISPSGYNDGWTFNGITSNTDSSYIYKNVSITPTGATYTTLSGSNETGSGSGATFDVLVNATSYTVTVAVGNDGGTGYVFGNKITIYGSQVGGIDGVNDITLTVSQLVGSKIVAVTNTGTVPAGSALYYTLSVYAKKGDTPSFDLYGIYSGASTRTSYVRFAFDTATVTVGNGGDNGLTPTLYGVQNLTNDWYRIWMAIYDTNALNTNLQYRIYPRNSSGNAGFSNFYGAQVEIGSTPKFYLTTTTGLYSAYGDYIVKGAGSGAVIVADETRSQSIYESRITDPGAGAGGSGYLTASNNAQGGGPQTISLAGADINTSANYNGMRIFINSGTGAGQFGYISSYNATTKVAYILKESLLAVSLISADTSDDTFTLAGTADVNSLYVNQPVQFIPTYYGTTVTATSQSNIVITSSVGGTINTLTTTNTAGLYYNMAVTFSGSIPSTMGVVANFTYYINEVINTNSFKIASTPFGNSITLTASTPSATMYMNIPSNSSYLTATTTNMIENMPIQFTGSSLGGITTGDVYYINDIINGTNFTISSSLLTGNITVASSSTKRLTVNSTSTLVPLNPIKFGETAIGGVLTDTKYYISKIWNSTQFSIAETLLVVNVTATEFGTNLITCSSTAGFVAEQPIKFTGNSFGGIVAETVYYVLAVNDAFTFTIAPAVGSINLTTASGAMTARTCPAAADLIDESGAMPYNTTTAKFTLYTSTGTMNAIFSTPIYGGVDAGTTYYVRSILPGSPNKITIGSVPSAGSAVNLTSGTGTMQMGEVGWDHVNPGTAIEDALDSTSLYFIEPRLNYSPPGFSQTATTLTTSGLLSPYTSVAYGDNYWIAIPTNSSTISGSSNGTTWTGLTLPTSLAAWSSIAYGNSAWIMVASDTSKVLYSFAKGQSWKAGTMPSASPWTQVVYTAGSFVAIASGKTYGAPSGTNLVGSGSGATFNVTATGTSYTVSVATVGNASYAQNDTIKILGTSLGGATPANDATITVAAINVFGGGVSSATISGTANSAGTSAYSTSYGASWSASALPGTQKIWTSLAASNTRCVAVSQNSTSAAYSINSGATWIASTLPDNGNWSSIAYGNSRFVAVQNGRSFSAQSGTNISGSGSTATFRVTTDGTSYSATTVNAGTGYALTNQIKILGTNLGGTTPANDLTITVSELASGVGDPTSIADISVTGTAKVTYPSYSFDGITWYTSPYTVAASKVAYGNGVFLAIKSGSTVAYTSEDGILWTKRAVTSAAYSTVAFGFSASDNIGAFVTVAGTGTGSKIFAGATTKGRPTVTDGIITSVSEFETGSNYSTLPTATLFDPNVTSIASITPLRGNGVLSSPTFIDRGTGYNTSSTAVTISGSGYADQYQTGLTIVVKNLSQLPRPGDDLTITGDSEIYKITNAAVLNGTVQPNITASIQISPPMSVAKSPDHNTDLIIREKYSQVRLTNHDFLNVGFGDQAQSGYPNPVPVETTLQAQNQTIENNYGRVFYTSTDQDGNFKVGSLFGVEQATGIVTLSASQFGLEGLTQLSLGGIAVGGSSVVVQQFSTDSTFVANSDAIIPTQRAVKSYLTSRLSQGGSNTFTGNTTAGQVTIGGPNVISNTIPQGTPGSSVQMLNKVNITGGGDENGTGMVDGNMMALDFFIKNSSRRG
jgi:hypothetical protein